MPPTLFFISRKHKMHIKRALSLKHLGCALLLTGTGSHVSSWPPAARGRSSIIRRCLNSVRQCRQTNGSALLVVQTDSISVKISRLSPRAGPVKYCCCMTSQGDVLFNDFIHVIHILIINHFSFPTHISKPFKKSYQPAS